MDAALEAKVKDIEPYLLPGLVVDRGCGTGAFMKYLAAKDHKVVGIELADEFVKEKAGVIQANVMDPVFADNFVDNIVLSSVMHEVYSYNGYSHIPVVTCLANCARELKPKGRIIIRDIWSPEPGHDGTPPYQYRFQLTPTCLERFRDFIKKSPQYFPHLGKAYNPKRIISLTEAGAVEFLSKKEYIQHWDLELKEIYTSIPLSVYSSIAKTLKLKVIEAKLIRNEWIIQNRWTKGVKGQLPPFTNQLIVLEKP